MTFSFGASSPQLLSVSTLSNLPRESPQCSVTLDRSALEPGVAYEFRVQATHFLHYSAVGQASNSEAFKSCAAKPCLLFV